MDETIKVELWRKRNDIWELLRTVEPETRDGITGYVLAPAWPADLDIIEGDIMGFHIVGLPELTKE